MRDHSKLFLGLALALVASVAVSEDENRYELECHLYKINGDFDGDISITDPIWSGFGDAKAEADPVKWMKDLMQNEDVSVFTVADLPDIAGLHLIAKENEEWTWNGEPEPPSSTGYPNVESLVAPSILNEFGQSFSVVVGPSESLEYFERLPDGNYKLVKNGTETGIAIRTADVEKASSGRLVLKDFEISVATVEEREPLEGTNLDIGKPIPSKHSFKRTISVQPGMDYGFKISFEKYGTVLAKIRLTLK